MSKPLITAFVAVFGLSSLAGCHHFHGDRGETYTPVAATPAPMAEPVRTTKWR